MAGGQYSLVLRCAREESLLLSVAITRRVSGQQCAEYHQVVSLPGSDPAWAVLPICVVAVHHDSTTVEVLLEKIGPANEDMLVIDYLQLVREE